MVTPVPRQVFTARAKATARDDVQRSARQRSEGKPASSRLFERRGRLHQDPEFVVNAPESEIKQHVRRRRERQAIARIIVPAVSQSVDVRRLHDPGLSARDQPVTGERTSEPVPTHHQILEACAATGFPCAEILPRILGQDRSGFPFETQRGIERHLLRSRKITADQPPPRLRAELRIRQHLQ